MNPTQKKYLKELKKNFKEEKKMLEEELVNSYFQKQQKEARILEIDSELLEIDVGLE